MNTSTIRACFRAVFGVYLIATCRSKSAFRPVGWRRKGARASSTSAKARKWASNRSAGSVTVPLKTAGRLGPPQTRYVVRRCAVRQVKRCAPRMRQ